jgi:phosphohistidine phosphatase
VYDRVVKVFLVRHAHADSEVPDGLDDAARALTHKARAVVQDHFADLADRMRGVDLVLTSPLVRTVQTAQILAVALQLDVPLRAHRSLLPDMPVGSQEALLSDHLSNTLVLVGHNPSIPAMAAHLLRLSQFPRAVTPGTVVALELESLETPARLVFFAPPGEPVVEVLEP